MENRISKQNPLLPTKPHKGDRNLLSPNNGGRDQSLDKTNRRQTDIYPRPPLDVARTLIGKENIPPIGPETKQTQLERQFKELERKAAKLNKQGENLRQSSQKQVDEIREWRSNMTGYQPDQLSGKDTNPSLSQTNLLREYTSDGQLANQENDTNPFHRMNGQYSRDSTLKPEEKFPSIETFEANLRAQHPEHPWNSTPLETSPLKDASGYWREEGSRPKSEGLASPLKQSEFLHNREWKSDDELKKAFNDRYAEAEDAKAIEARYFGDKLKTLMYRKFGDEIVKSDLLKDLGTSETHTEVTKIRDGNPSVYKDGDTYFVTYDEQNAQKQFGANEDLSKRRIPVNDALLQELEKNEAYVKWDLPKVSRVELWNAKGEKQVVITDNETTAISNREQEGWKVREVKRQENELSQDFPLHKFAEHDAASPYSEYGEVGLSHRHEVMRDQIQGLQRRIQETETTGDWKANASYWKEWQHMQESGDLAAYETSKIQQWREQQTENLVNKEIDMDNKIKEGDMKFWDKNVKMKNLMMEYRKEEMQRTLNEVERRIGNDEGYYQEQVYSGYENYNISEYDKIGSNGGMKKKAQDKFTDSFDAYSSYSKKPLRSYENLYEYEDYGYSSSEKRGIRRDDLGLEEKDTHWDRKTKKRSGRKTLKDLWRKLKNLAPDNQQSRIASDKQRSKKGWDSDFSHDFSPFTQKLVW